MGPSIFIMYSAPLEDVIIRATASIAFHMQMIHSFVLFCFVFSFFFFFFFCTFHHDKRAETISKLECCLNDVKAWTHGNRLKLNDAKTEVVHVTSRFVMFVKIDPIKNVVLGETNIAPTDEVRNLGVTFDNHLSMLSHVNKVYSQAFLVIRSIGQIRRYLDKDSAEKLVHAFVTSRLDYCNSLLYGLPHKLISKLQRIQNAAARLVLGLKKHDHISQALKDLHRLLIRKRVVFKILLIIYKTLNNAPVRTIFATFSYPTNLHVIFVQFHRGCLLSHDTQQKAMAQEHSQLLDQNSGTNCLRTFANHNLQTSLRGDNCMLLAHRP